ncbi:hypothetical protein D3C87_84740 [compost metagenome]
MKRILLLCILLGQEIGYSQSVTTASIIVSQDTYTYSGNPAGIYYTSTTNPVYVDASSHYYRSFYKFDLSSIPVNSVIVNAQLMLVEDGRENVGQVNSMELFVDACNTNWNETTLSHNTNVQANTILPTITVSNHPGLYRQFDMKEHVQAMVDNRVPNYGWRMRRNPENAQTPLTRYLSKESSATLFRPFLLINYYRAAVVSAATVVHASGGSSNGSVSPTVLYGSSATRTHRWYNSSGTQIATSLNLSNQPYGWYGLKSWGTTPGDTLFQAFLIGSKCETVDVAFNPGADYVDNAVIADGTVGGVATNSNQSNSANYATINAEQSSLFNIWYRMYALMRFRLWVDPALEINEAKMTLYGSGHNPAQRSNASRLTLLTSAWKETGVSASIRPTLGALSIAIPNMPAGNGNSALELKDFFNSWKTNNPVNHGMDLSLQSYVNPPVVGSTATRVAYESAHGTNKPTVAFKVSWVGSECDFTSYARFRDELDASFVHTVQGKLKIQFNEDYDQKLGRMTKLILYDATNNQVKAGINNNGSSLGVPLLPAKLLEFDYNQHILDLTTYSLVSGRYYVMELTNSKGEKSYIKFKYFN